MWVDACVHACVSAWVCMRVLVSYLADARDIKQFIPKLRQWKLSERCIRQLAFNQLHRSVGVSCSHKHDHSIQFI